MTSKEDISKLVIVADPSKGVKVNAAVVAKPFREEIKAKVEAMKQAGYGKKEVGRCLGERCGCVCALAVDPFR